MTYHRGRGILFGGVHDVEESEEGMDSEFFNQLFTWNIERNRFFPMGLRKPRTQKKAGMEQRVGRRGRAQANEEELLKQLAALQAGASLEDADNMEIDLKDNEPDEPEKPTREMPVSMEFPHPRFNAQLTVQDDVLYIYGGTFEKDDREFTFDDLYAIDLGKMDGCKEIFSREVENWVVRLLPNSTPYYPGDTDPVYRNRKMRTTKMTKMRMTMMKKKARMRTSTCSRNSWCPPVNVRRNKGTKSRLRIRIPQNGRPNSKTMTRRRAPPPHRWLRMTASHTLVYATQPNPTSYVVDKPRSLKHRANEQTHQPFESRREFFSRTSNEWQEILMTSLRWKGIQPEGMLVKEIKTKAFEMSEEKWWDCREEITALEDEQEAAGIGEVVSLADKGSGAATGGAGRRR